MCKHDRDNKESAGRRDADDVKRVAKDEGSEKATEKMLDDVHQSEKKHGSGSDEHREYIKDYTEKLQKDGLLPTLAVEWLKGKHGHLDSNGDGAIDDDEMSKAIDKSDDGKIDKHLLKALRNAENGENDDGKKLLDIIRRTNDDGDGHKGVSLKDAEEYLNNLKLTNMLMKDDGKLYKLLENIHDRRHGRHGDGDHDDDDDKHRGKIDRDDIKDLLDDIKDHPGKHGLSADEIAALKRLHDNWDESFIKALREGDCLTRKALLDGVGKKDEKDVLKALEGSDEGDGSEAAAPTETTTTAATSTTSGDSEGAASAVEVLAKNPELVVAITDQNGMVARDKLDQFISQMAGKGSSEELNALYSLRRNFDALSEGKNEVSLDKLTKRAYGEDARFGDRLNQNGNGPISAADRGGLEQQIGNDAVLLGKLTDGNGTITRRTIQSFNDELALAERNGLPPHYTPEQIAAVRKLSNSFNVISENQDWINPFAIDKTNGIEDWRKRQSA